MYHTLLCVSFMITRERMLRRADFTLAQRQLIAEIDEQKAVVFALLPRQNEQTAQVVIAGRA